MIDDNLWHALSVLPSVRAKLVKQDTVNGVGVTAPVGTEYITYPITAKMMRWTSKSGDIVVCRSIWVRRADDTTDVGGWVPEELFEQIV